jgi:uncharacterized protein
MTTLNLLLKPTSFRCNLACDYCFYKKTQALYPEQPVAMTAATMETVIRQALSFGRRTTSFCWQGGEPTLLGVSFFEKVIAVQERYRGKGQSITNSIQTNGLLLDEAWCRFLKTHDFLVGLSLDGPAEIHNRYRKTSGGSGSFDRVIKSAVLMQKYRVAFNILTLLTDANVDQAQTLYTFFRKNTFRHIQLIPCFETDPSTGTPLAFTVNGDQLGRFYCRFFDLWWQDGFPYVSVRLFEDILLYLLDGVHASCSWFKRCDGYLLVEHNGDCFPCDFFVSPEWRLGNLCEDSLATLWDHPKRTAFADLKSEVPAACRVCTWRSFCNGDCTRLRTSGRAQRDGASVFCKATRMLLEHMAARTPEIGQRAMNIRTALQQNKLIATGRNAPCPCGSDHKFKRCCGREPLIDDAITQNTH